MDNQLNINKSAPESIVSAGQVVNYAITVSAPEFVDELRNGTAFDVVVTDSLPEGLAYVAGSANPAATLVGQDLTWNIESIAPGSEFVLTYSAIVDPLAAASASYTNTVVASGFSTPDPVPGTVETPEVSADVTVSVGATRPLVSKTALSSVSGNGTIDYEVSVTWPGDGSTWSDATLVDSAPDGVHDLQTGTIECSLPSGCAAPAGTAMPSQTDAAGAEHLGWFFGEVGPFTEPTTWTWRYSGSVSGTTADGSAIALGAELDNIVSLYFNTAPRLGGVLPGVLEPPPFDGEVEATATFTYGRPVIEVDKSLVGVSPIDPATQAMQFDLTFTNVGNVTAASFNVGDISSISSLSSITSTSTCSATATLGGSLVVNNLAPGCVITVRAVLADPASFQNEPTGEQTNRAWVQDVTDPDGVTYPEQPSDSVPFLLGVPHLVVDKVTDPASLPSGGAVGDGPRFTFTVTNTGDGTAYGVGGTDMPGASASFADTSCDNGASLSAWGSLYVPRINPGAVVTCSYRLELQSPVVAGSYINKIDVDYRNGWSQTAAEGSDGACWYPNSNACHRFTTSDESAWMVKDPTLTIQKYPDAGSGGNLIVSGGDASYQVVLTNPGAVPARLVNISDTLPTPLVLAGTPTVSYFNFGSSPQDATVTGTSGGTSFGVDLGVMPPHSHIEVLVPVHAPAGVSAADELVNTATASADRVAPISDDGVLTWLPAIDPPVASKVATPDSGAPGSTHTWTLTMSLPSNPIDINDLTFVDTFPDGLDVVSVGTVSCTASAGACPTVETLPVASQPDGSTRLAFFAGDIPSTTAFVLTVDVTARVASTYEGTGEPAAGTEVLDASLRNLIRPYFNIGTDPDRFDDTTRPDLNAPLLGQFGRRGSNVVVPFTVLAPLIVLDKTVTNLGDPVEWDNSFDQGLGYQVDIGGAVNYSLVVTNEGSADAFNVDIVDDLGGGALRGVTLDPIAGVTVTDGWTEADPTVHWVIDTIPIGGSVTLTYSGITVDSPDLVPAVSGDNRDVGMIRNTADVAEFFSDAASTTRFTSADEEKADVYVYTPVAYTEARGCVDGLTASGPVTGAIDIWVINGVRTAPSIPVVQTLATPGNPVDTSIATGYDTHLEFELIGSGGAGTLGYVFGSATVDGVAYQPTSYVNAAGNSVLVFELGDVPYTQRVGAWTPGPGDKIHINFDARTTMGGIQGGGMARVWMDDATGAPGRGDAASADYLYFAQEPTACAGQTDLELVKLPDAAKQLPPGFAPTGTEEPAPPLGESLIKARGETVTWWMTTWASQEDTFEYHDAVITDILPADVDILPNTAQFWVRRGDGSLSVVAPGQYTEVITPLPDGRQQIVWTAPQFAAFHRITWTFDSVVTAAAVFGTTQTNYVQVDPREDIFDNCPTQLVECDTGSIVINDPSAPVIEKSVDRIEGAEGETFRYAITARVPANDITRFDAVLTDLVSPGSSADPITNSVLTCLSGCASDPAPVWLPPVAGGDDRYVWSLGDLPPSPDERIYRWTYDIATVATHSSVERSGEQVPERVENLANLKYHPFDRFDFGSGTLTTDTTNQVFSTSYLTQVWADQAVKLWVPYATVQKECVALVGTTGSAPQWPDHPWLKEGVAQFGETATSEANVRCRISVLNPVTDGTLGEWGAITDLNPTAVSGPFEIVDYLPTFLSSDSGSYPVTYDVRAVQPAPGATLVGGVNYSPSQNAATSLDFAVGGVTLENGEVTYVDVFLDVDIDDSALGSLTTAFGINLAELVRFSDVTGSHEYTFTQAMVDGGYLAFAPPQVFMDKKVWNPAEYAAVADTPLDHCFTAQTREGHSFDPAPGTGDVLRLGCDRNYEGWGHELLNERESFPIVLQAGFNGIGAVNSLQVIDTMALGTVYAGNPRLVVWDETSQTNTEIPLPDPQIEPGVGAFACGIPATDWGGAQWPDYRPKAAYSAAGQVLTWDFTRASGSPMNAPWDEALNYGPMQPRNSWWELTELPVGSRIVVVFDAAFTQQAADCMDDIQNSNMFENLAEVVGTTVSGQVTDPMTCSNNGSPTPCHSEFDYFWANDPLTVSKTPDAGYVGDGTTGNFTVTATFNDRSYYWDRDDGCASWGCDNWNEVWGDGPILAPKDSSGFLDVWGPNGNYGAFAQNWPQLTDPVTISPMWADQFFGSEASNGLGQLEDYLFTGSPLTITDTFIDDGLYVPGSATAKVLDPWGDVWPAGTLVSEDIVSFIDPTSGRQAKTITWKVDNVPAPAFQWGAYDPEYTDYRTYSFPSSVRIQVPLDVPVGTPDGTTYPNAASAAIDFTATDGSLGWAYNTPTDSALLTVVNPAEPPVVSKTPDRAVIAPGDEFWWEFTTTLAARDVWFDLAFVDNLPNSFQYLSSEAPTCEFADHSPCDVALTALAPAANADGTTALSWWAGDLAGESTDRTLHWKIKVRFVGPETSGDQLSNTIEGFSNAENTFGSPTSVPAADTYTYTHSDTGTVLVGEPALTIDKQVVNLADGPFDAGDTVTWSITVTNTGSTTAFGVPIVDTPQNAVFQSVTAATPFVAQLTKNWTSYDPTIRWYFPAIPAGESRTVYASGVVRAQAVMEGYLVGHNSGSVPSYLSNPRSPDRRVYPSVSDTADAPLIAPQIVVEKFADEGCSSTTAVFQTATPVQWCLRVTNNGSGMASQVVVTDRLPAGWTFDSADAPTPAVSTLLGNVVLGWPAFDLDPGASVELHYRTIPGGSRSDVTNRAFATVQLPDGSYPVRSMVGYTSTDLASAYAPDAGLEITKLPDFQSVRCDIGAICNVAWDITVTNADDAVLTEATMADELPAGVTYVSSTTPAGWDAPIVGASGSGPSGSTPISWAANQPLAIGSSHTFQIIVSVVGGSLDQRVLNTAIANAAEIPVSVENQALAFIWAPGSIGDFVWVDADHDGQQDQGELGVEGVTVNLTGTDSFGNSVSLQTQTGPDGLYLFDDLVSGDYTVMFDYSTLPAGMFVTQQGLGDPLSDSDPDVVTGSVDVPLAAGEDRTDIDLGVWQPGALGNFVWLDADLDGQQGPGELPVSGVVVTIANLDGSDVVDADGVVVGPQTVGPDGAYLFTNLVPGEYLVHFEAPTGYSLTSTGADPLSGSDSNASQATGWTTAQSVSSGNTNDTVDAGVVLLGSIGDFVWVDVDNDGHQDSGEPGIGGVVVTLTGVDAFGHAVSLQTETGADGSYLFDGLVPGTYTVIFGDAPGYGHSPSDSGDDASDSDPASGSTVVLGSGQNIDTVDHGVTLGSIGDVVWFDLDADGVQDSGEPPVAGVTVELFDGDGNLLDSVVTGSDGSYLFDGLVAGEYVVVFTLPDGTTWTVADVGSDTTDSDVDGSGHSSVINLGAGESNLTIDAGVVAPLNVGIVKTVASAPAAIGDTATWLLSIRNDSLIPALAPVVVTDDLPQGLSFVSSESAEATCSAVGQLVTCTLDRALAADESFDVEIVTAVNVEGDVINVAEVSVGSGQVETTLSDNIDDAFVSVGSTVPSTTSSTTSSAVPTTTSSTVPSTTSSTVPTTTTNQVRSTVPNALAFSSPTPNPTTGANTKRVVWAAAGVALLGLMLIVAGRRRRNGAG